MSSDVGTPMMTSQSPALSVLRMKPRRCDHQTYSTGSPSSRPMSCASRFSNPSPRSFENGRLFGSAQTRIDGRALATVLDARAPSMTATAASMHITAAAVRLREREDIQHASLLRSGRQVAHGVYEPERRGRVARVQNPGDDGARPSAYSRQDSDVLPPDRAAVRH